MIMRLKRIFDIAGCACVVAWLADAQFCEVSDWSVVLYLGTVIYGMSVIYRAVKSTPGPSGATRLLGWFNQIHRHDNDG